MRRKNMSEEGVSNALDAIHDEAQKLLQLNLPPEVKKDLELILAIARYKTDVRSRQERPKQIGPPFNGGGMRVQQKTYQNNTIRYLELRDNDLLLNTTDVLGVLEATDRPEGSVLAEPCLDLASAEIVSLGSNRDFAEWLMRKFSGYKRKALVHPGCTDEWIFD